MLRPLAGVCAATILAAAAAFANPSTPDWFGRVETARLRLAAPFNDLFAHAQQDGYAVRGTLTWTEGGREQRLDDVKITVRGNTSRRQSECTFPKLKLSWADGSIKVGTHCGNATGDTITPKYGRLPNENSPVREAFVYRLLDILGVPTLRARQARITYEYTDVGDDTAATIERNAFLLEDDSAARRRLGAARIVPPERFTNARDAFAPEDAARLAFAEALIGNFDWCLRFFKEDTYRCDARRPLWNVLAFAWPDGAMRPLMYDFDVSGAVAGYHRWFGDIFNPQFMASRAAVEVTAQLQHARTLFDRGVLDGTRRAFAEKRDAAYRAVEESPVDENGKKVLKEYLDPFFEAMQSDAAFYRPVVVSSHTRVYADPEGTMPVCASVGAVPVGTPIGKPLQTRGDMMQAVLLDALWKYAPPVRCPFVRQKPVWIATAAVGTQYP